MSRKGVEGVGSCWGMCRQCIRCVEVRDQSLEVSERIIEGQEFNEEDERLSHSLLTSGLSSDAASFLEGSDDPCRPPQ